MPKTNEEIVKGYLEEMGPGVFNMMQYKEHESLNTVYEAFTGKGSAMDRFDLAFQAIRQSESPMIPAMLAYEFMVTVVNPGTGMEFVGKRGVLAVLTIAWLCHSYTYVLTRYYHDFWDKEASESVDALLSSMDGWEPPKENEESTESDQ